MHSTYPSQPPVYDTSLSTGMAAVWKEGSGTSVVRSGSALQATSEAVVGAAKQQTASFKLNAEELEKQVRGAAAVIARNGNVSQAQLELLLSAAQQHCQGAVGLSTSLEEALESLLSHVKQLMGECSGLKAKVGALEQTVKGQQAAMEQQGKNAQLLRRQVLLGQLAYSVDDAAMLFVMADERGRKTRQSLSGLLALQRIGRLNQQQQ